MIWLVTVMVWLIITIAHISVTMRNGAQMRRMEALLPTAPSFSPPRSGVHITSDLLPDSAQPHDVLLAFLSPGCGSCERAIDMIQSCQDSSLSAVAVVDHRQAPRDDLKSMLDRLTETQIPVVDVLSVEALIDLLEVSGFPSFARLDEQGRARQTCIGIDGLPTILGSVSNG